MFEIIEDVKRGKRNASDIYGFALWWPGKTFWIWFLFAIMGTVLVVLFHK